MRGPSASNLSQTGSQSQPLPPMSPSFGLGRPKPAGKGGALAQRSELKASEQGLPLSWGNDTNGGVGVRGKESKNPSNKPVSGTSILISLMMSGSKPSAGSDRGGDFRVRVKKQNDGSQSRVTSL